MIKRLAVLLTRGYRFFKTLSIAGDPGNVSKNRQSNPEYYLSMFFYIPTNHIYIDSFDVSVGPGHYEDK